MMTDHLEQARKYFYELTTTSIQQNDPKTWYLNAGLVQLTLGLKEIDAKLSTIRKELADISR